MDEVNIKKINNRKIISVNEDILKSAFAFCFLYTAMINCEVELPILPVASIHWQFS